MLAGFLQRGNPGQNSSLNLGDVPVPEIGSSAQFLVTLKGIGAVRLQTLERRCSFWQTIGGRVPV